ncbi:MAG: hypothetical protein AB8F74_11910 [Saprospiraceae bacterium]
MQLINFSFAILLLLGVLGLLMPAVFGGDDFVKLYKVIVQLYLFGFTAFQVLKRVFFYKVKGDINIIRLVKTSEAQQRLLIQGVAITGLFIAYMYSFENLMHFDTIMIGILLVYYTAQVFEHGRPSIYIDDHSISYDDYVVSQWPWEHLEKIELEEEQLRIVGVDSAFELDFESIDDIDFVRLDDELQRSVLDGEFTSSLSSKDLVGIIKGHAEEHNVLVLNN